MRILSITASPGEDSSVSSKLSSDLALRLLEGTPGAQLVTRDLHRDPPPHWGAAQVGAAFTDPERRTEEQRRALSLSDRYCAELKSADLLIVATPMWNFSVPSVLKAWIDHVVRVGQTFYYENGVPQGLLGSIRTAYLIEATGGLYAASPMEALNHVGPYLEQLLSFLGVRQIARISAQGTALDGEDALKRGREQISNLTR